MFKAVDAIKLGLASAALFAVFSVSIPAPAAVHVPMPHRTARAVAARHQKTYAKAWEYVRQNYYDRNKLSNWDNWRNRFDGKLGSRSQLEKALDEMLGSLSDDYTFVLSEDALKTREKQQKSHSVSSARILSGNLGYVKLDNFSGGSVAGEMKNALRKVSGADGIILDLRGNHGGFIEEAHDVFSMLTDDGLFMTYNGFLDGAKDDQAFVLKRDSWNVLKNGKLSSEHRKPNLIGNKPLVLLVDEDTRSAAEMLAGALGANQRAVVIGRQTYGKGVLQDTFEIGESLALKVVTAKYYLPDGTNIHEKGIEPDIEMRGSSEEQLSRAAQLLSSSIAEARSTGRRFLAVIEQAGANL